MPDDASQREIVARLNDARDSLYSAFSEYTRPAQLDISPLKSPVQIDSIERALKAVPLRQLEPDDIGTYSGSAIYTAGDDLDYRYFLPRILDLAISESPGYLGLEGWCIAAHLHNASWTAWPEKERMAIMQFFSAAFHACAHRDPEEIEAIDWVVGLGILDCDVTPFLNVWNSNGSQASLKQFADVVQRLASDLIEKQKGKRSWLDDVSHPNIARLSEWIRSRKTKDLLLVGLEQASADDDWRFRSALEELEALT